jgi:hypothetical protein
MLRTVATKVAWVGRTASMVFGLALVMALVLGVATMAFAAVPGDPFRLGKLNAIDAMTRLVGTNPNVMLKVTNGGTGSALGLEVKQGVPPMRLNSSKKVPNLNADHLDGQDSASFLSSERIYNVTRSSTVGANTINVGGASCDTEDWAISGGFKEVDPTSHVRTSAHGEAFKHVWNVTVQTGSTSDAYIEQAVCMDLPPLRQ